MQYDKESNMSRCLSIASNSPRVCRPVAPQVDRNLICADPSERDGAEDYELPVGGLRISGWMRVADSAVT